MTDTIFIGSGKLATNVAQAFLQGGIHISLVYSRTLGNAQALADKVGAEATCDLAYVCARARNLNKVAIFYALTDTALPEVVAQIDAPNAYHFHTAGSMPLSVFGQDKPHAGVFYPFQGFSKERQVDFHKVNLFLTAKDNETMSIGHKYGKTIGCTVMEADDDTRCRIHMAGVLTNNFITALCGMAAEQLKKGGIPFDVMYSLLDETIAKVKQANPRRAQSGPAIRHDAAVMQKHLELLKDEPDVADIYQMISKNIMAHS